MEPTGEYERDAGPAQKVSVSMPAGRVAAVKARVGARGFSAYVSAAVERQIQRDLLEELLQEKEAEIGAPSPEIEEWASEIFRDAEALADEAGDEAHGHGGEEWGGREAS
ncbi:hypothetical protein GL263_10135 [Streptomyces durbertensis]|uniref:CopG family transcriptional regulator n=1 Tax=Streptomyces durbertensis TaxID=2448886 RepID=A0ABR6EF12_9ACTN|nr:hypothetical protein [Streptomyces durbertensis]MBB1243912.1 hypothetical protein [Streptomyces durbertensis]